MGPHCAMAHGRNRSKDDPYPRDTFSHMDRIISGQGKIEENISSQLLVASHRKHNQYDVVVAVLLCIHSGVGEKGLMEASSPTCYLEQDCGHQWVKPAMASSSWAVKNSKDGSWSKLIQCCQHPWGATVEAIALCLKAAWFLHCCNCLCSRLLSA